MKVESINIKNFKKLKSVEKEINGKNVYVMGGNGVGKTSFLDAFWVGLTGKGLPPEPTTDGAKRGLIEIDLGDFIARTKLTKGKPVRFELENKEFTNESERFIKAPRSYMEQRIGLLNFDVNEFFAKSDAEKLKYLAKIMDCNFTDLDADLEELMEVRKFDKRKLKEVEVKVNYFNAEDAKKELVDVVKLSKELREKEDQEREYNRILEGIEQRRMKLAEIEKQRKELEEQAAKVSNEIVDGEDWLEEEKNKPYTSEVMDALRNTINTANETNEKIKEAKEAEKADQEAEELREAVESTTYEIDKKREEKAIRISEQINIPGLAYEWKSETFLYEGLPFDAKQQNTAAQLIAGMRIAASMLKELRIIKVDASLIDKENFEKVLAWANKEKIELFVELVDREATNLSINIVDE
jgi:predicted ATP-dependent endonuclease of OLD family